MKSPDKKSSGDPEIDAMWAKICKMRDDLDTKLQELYEKSGMSPKDLQNFLDNPDNFGSKLQWDFLQERRAELENKIWGSSGGKEIKAVAEKQKKEKQAKGRKGKMIGARKGWMPMK